MTMRRLAHDICIVGAGPVGLALANCLVRSPLVSSIAMIDRKIPAAMQKPYPVPNQRVYAINGPSLNILESVGVLSKIRQMGRLQHIEVASKEASRFVEWKEDHARVIENDQLVNALKEGLSEHSSKVEWIEGEIQSIDHQKHSQCEVGLKDCTLQTKLLVGSDGNRSKVRELTGVSNYGWKYNQKAIACTLEMEDLKDQANNQAYQVFHDDHILGILPLWKNYLSIVWSLAFPDFEHAMSLDEAAFVETLNGVIDRTNQAHSHDPQFRTIGRIKGLANKRLAFPLASTQVEHYTRHRVALIGDAAHSIHPMAGLGVNSGIIDAALLANTTISNLKTGNDIGEAISLQAFQSKSRAMNVGNAVAIEAMKKGMQSDLGLLNPVRQQVLGLLQGNSQLKSTMRGLVANNPLIDLPHYEWESA